MSGSGLDWGRFDDELKELVRSRLDARDLVVDAGLARVRPGARSLLIRCISPDHEDRHPSCSVSRGGFRCFACGHSGDVFDLVGALASLTDFRSIVREAASLAGVDYDEERARFLDLERDHAPERARVSVRWEPDEHASLEPRGDEDAAEDELGEVEEFEDDAERRSRIWRFVLARLELGGSAAGYVASRGIDLALPRALGVRGAGKESWRAALRAAWRRFGPEDLEDAGLLGRDRAGKPTPHPLAYSDMVVFPYATGHAIDSLRFRQLDPHASVRYLSLIGAHNQPPHAYLADARHRPMFGAAVDGVLFVTEGEFNALSIVGTGRAAVGLPGAMSWRHEFAVGFRSVERVVVLLDGDDASAALEQRVRGSCEVVLGAEWARDGLRFATLRDASGAPIDANDAHCQGTLEGDLARVVDQAFG